MTKTFYADYNGERIGKRTSKDRIYTHAIVVVDVPGRNRDQWCAPQRDTRENRRSFDYYRSIADGSYVHIKYVEPKDITRAQLIVSAGYEAWLKAQTEANIASYQRFQDALKLEPYVFGWSMSAANAEKMARQATSERFGKKLIAILPVTAGR